MPFNYVHDNLMLLFINFHMLLLYLYVSDAKHLISSQQQLADRLREAESFER